MIDNIGGIVIFVSNQASAIEFYTEKLGFDVKGEYPYKNTKWVEVGPKTSTTTISLMEPHPDMMTNEEIEQAKKEIGTMTNLWFYTNNINNTYKELQEKGVNITEPKKQDWGGIMSQIKDQDNNILTLISSYEDHDHNK
ncbi:MAG TPA: VOC family protein [Nitrososphaeraceae archaeon]|jgi:lactoylglutathione lyase|nr:VOC family protein [Nitrososphaeraceae archaeon]